MELAAEAWTRSALRVVHWTCSLRDWRTEHSMTWRALAEGLAMRFALPRAACFPLREGPATFLA